MSNTPAHDELLTPAEVAAMWRVDVKTVARWAKEGRLRCIRTLGVNGPGHRRFFAAEVRALMTLDGETGKPALKVVEDAS